MAQIRNKLVGFQAKQSEYDRIENVIKILDTTKSEYIREVVMKDVARLEKKSK